MTLPSRDRNYWTYVERRRLSALLSVLPKRTFDRMIDFGCGRGEFLRGFCEFVPVHQVHGVDGSPQAVAAARERGIDAIVLNLNTDRLPDDSGSVDLVMMVETIEHLEDVEHCLDEVRRVLRPFGSLLVTTPNLASWHGRISLALGFQPLSLDVGFRKHYGSLVTLSGKSAGHIRGFTRPALADLLQTNGFQVTAWSGSPAVATGNSAGLHVLRAIDRGFSRIPGLASEIIAHAIRNAGEN